MSRKASAEGQALVKADADLDDHPLRRLEEWLAGARAAGLAEHDAVALATAGADGQPSTRIVQLKRVERDALLFTSALWTRKAREIAANPRVSLLAYWPTLGRQAHISGEATLAERSLAVELFAGRSLERQLQAVVSRQGSRSTTSRSCATGTRT